MIILLVEYVTYKGGFKFRWNWSQIWEDELLGYYRNNADFVARRLRHIIPANTVSLKFGWISRYMYRVHFKILNDLDT